MERGVVASSYLFILDHFQQGSRRAPENEEQSVQRLKHAFLCNH